MEDRKYTLKDAVEGIEYLVKQCVNNNLKPEDVPFLVQESFHNFIPGGFFMSWGDGVKTGIKYYKDDEVKVVVPDVRPEGGGEYWKSRGASDDEVSGYVRSKEAGERLLRLVRYVLEKDLTETWLDYSRYKPTRIQFKFSAKEFDVKKLDKLSCENNDILTEEIIKECVKK